MKKKLHIEYIAVMGLYRVYDKKHPAQTIAYEKSIEDAQKHAIENGYSGVDFEF